MTEFAFEGAKRNSTAIGWSFANQTFAGDSATPFSSPINPASQSAVVAAFARWSSVSSVTFNQVTDGAAVPIRVGFGNFALVGELGETDYRYSRGVLANGTLIRLLDPATLPLIADATGQLFYQGYGATLYQVVLHEIGHALGLDHTTDPGTNMFPYALTSNRDLAAGDIQGINTLYPLYTVALGMSIQVEGASGQTTPYTFVVTRYGDPGVALTVGYSVRGVPLPGITGSTGATAGAFAGAAYPSGTFSFAAGSTTASLSVIVAGNAAAQPDQGFALALNSLDPGDSITVRGTLSAAILDDDGYGQVNGASLGIYRFFDALNGTHFYSASQMERNTLLQTRADLVYEGFGLNAVASPASDPAASPVFRFFDVDSGTHFFSVSTVERDTILATRTDLRFEGTAFYEHVKASTGDAPVYRFFNGTDGTHFYTSSVAERAAILAGRPDLRDEGIGFYAPTG